MKYINKIGMTVVAGALLATTACSDYADYNEVPGLSSESAGKSLYENIVSNPQLTGVAELIQAAGAQDMLNAPQSYTFWAPVDGTYDLEAMKKLSPEQIKQQFFNQHMAQFTFPVQGAVNERVITLNEKIHNFTNAAFDKQEIQQTNIPSSNGIMHLINGQSMYYSNLFQYIADVPASPEFQKFIQAYNLKTIDKSKSVLGPLVNGQQTYLDTVYRESNPVVSRILNAQLDNEDSTYTMLFPTSEAWQTAYTDIKGKYKFKDGFKWIYLDENSAASSALQSDFKSVIYGTKVSLDGGLAHYTDSIVKYNITRNLVFSHNDTYNTSIVNGSSNVENDTIRSTNNRKLSNVSEILAAMGPREERSNGFAASLTSFPFLPRETYEPVISIKPTNSNICRSLALKSRAVTYDVVKSELLADRDTLFTNYPTQAWIKGTDLKNSFVDGEYRYKCPDFIKKMLLPESSRFMSYISTDEDVLTNGTANPELDFRLTNTLATKYHIFVVIMPMQLKDPEATVYTSGQYLRFDLAYNDAEGTPKWYRLNVPGASKSTDPIVLKPDYINVVELEFEFPISYFGIQQRIGDRNVNVAPTLMITNDASKVKWNTTANKKKFDHELRIGGIFMIPESAMEYYRSQKF